jgi:chemotaxis protein CheZ
MGGPRKVFRIEETAIRRPREPSEDAPAHHAELMAALGALRGMLAAAGPLQSDNGTAPHDAETAHVRSELTRISMTIGGATDQRAASMMRVAHELDAVVTSTEHATQNVLAAAEEIDQLANNLSAALKGKIEQGIAQDIQDYVIKIFEACNFQDLAGQRITKVMATLNAIEGQITHLFDVFKNATTASRRSGAQDLHGPRLDYDNGHASQEDVDIMFDR